MSQYCSRSLRGFEVAGHRVGSGKSLYRVKAARQ